MTTFTINLTEVQARALRGVAKTVRCRDTGGWLVGPDDRVPTAIVEALGHAGLVKINPIGGCMGSVEITRLGREALEQMKATHQ